MQKFKKSKAVIPFLLMIFFSSHTFSQKTISLQAAIDTALQQNLVVQASKLRTLSAMKLENSATDIPLTNLSAEYGKVNSAYNDTKFGISQTVSFPVVYKKQKLLLEALTESNLLNEKVIKNELRKQVTFLFFQMCTMQEKISLLQRADSLYNNFLQRQLQRFNAGDANLLEKTAAETQRMQVANQLQQIESDFKIVQSQFGKLLNSDENYFPAKTALQATLITIPDTSFAAMFPMVKLKAQQQNVALQEIEVQKTRSLPQVSLAYFNQSIIGQQKVNGVEKNFTSSNRFSAAEVGLHIPLFNRANKARVAAAKTNYDVTTTEYEEVLKQQKSILQQLILRYQKNQQALTYFEKSALRQSAILSENANLQFTNGAINFIEWMMLINQSISIEAEYINAVNDRNQTVIELNSFNENN